MEKLNLTEAQGQLCALIGHNLFSAPLDIKEDAPWDEVIKESILQSVPLLAFKNYRELPLSEQNVSKVKSFIKKCSIANVNCFKGHEYLHKIMTDNAIPYCIIKGAASSYRYPDPLLRSMGDVDFYVPPQYTEKARAIFTDEGFVCDEHPHSFHVGMERGSLRIEMHFAPIASPGGKIGEIFNEYWSDICDTAVLTRDVFSEYYLPSDFHHGFILLTHLKSHIIPVGIGLRHVCDWAVFVNSFSDEEFRNLFEERLKRVGLWRFAKAVSLVAVLLFGMPHKAWMGEDYEIASALADDITSGGNFGRREKNRSFEGVFIADYKETGRSKNGIARAFATANGIVRKRWRAARWCPLLYPIGWVYFTLRFIFNRMTGKNDANVIKSYKKSGKRIKVYEDLKFFKSEE